MKKRGNIVVMKEEVILESCSDKEQWSEENEEYQVK